MLGCGVRGGMVDLKGPGKGSSGLARDLREVQWQLHDCNYSRGM
jgi:hypothetical protein